MPLIETRGAGSAQGFGEFAQSAAPVYIEDVFSTYVYTGSGTSKTITNGIDLSGKGGLVWTKMRSSPVSNAHNHRLSDSAIGVNQVLSSNNTDPKTSSASFGISSFNSDGYTITNPGSNGGWNHTNDTFVSWTFRKQAKFFDIVTYTGNGSSQTINHNLGSTPGCIIIKKLDSTTFNAGWAVYHRSLDTPSFYYLRLDITDAQTNYGGSFISNVGSTSFDVNGASGQLGLNGSSYVAYLFAHDAGGFGLSGSDNVISCGSFTTDGSGNATVSLGYEPQWFLRKRIDSTGNWTVVDNMRGFTAGGTDAFLYPNLSDAEVTSGGSERLTSTGVQITGFGASMTFIYIAIRRGPMKTPTSGTSVFEPTTTATATSPGATATTGFPVDLSVYALRNYAGLNSIFFDRLRGTTATSSARLTSSSTAAEATSTANGIGIQSNTTVTENWTGVTGYTNILWNFRRAPGFFDVVCYAGTGSNLTVSHNLTVAPQLIIIKNRTNTWSWNVGYNFGVSSYDFLTLDNTDPGTNNAYNSHYTAAPTTTQFFLATNVRVNQSSANFVAYLFATVAGVSKVGSYTGTGTTLQIDCGFTGGARFVLIKRTDSTGDWYVYDSARGIVSGNDPYLLLNSTAAEVTNTDYVDTYSAGFELSSTAPAALNANGGTYIFLAIA